MMSVHDDSTVPLTTVHRPFTHGLFHPDDPNGNVTSSRENESGTMKGSS
jgi:hypothetical protein